MSSSSNGGAIGFRPCRDPYDLWAAPTGVAVRRLYYAGSLLGRVGAAGVGLLDWLLPEFGRRVIGTKQVYYPIVVALEVLSHQIDPVSEIHRLRDMLRLIQSIAVKKANEYQWSWGLGFPWMSKNGLYGPDVPFVTHTPYVMEALLTMAEHPGLHDEAMAMFNGTWSFLESLKLMYQDEDTLALSYAPVDEPRIVVNANSYAAFAYALHAMHGRDWVRPLAREKALHLARWVVSQQEQNGCWWYYADREPGNFIDCFHSCFVVKNLIKVKRLLPETGAIVDESIERGWRFIREELYDKNSGLCRRFAVRSHCDPYRWDLYDQAEYLGLLVDFGLLDEARVFAARVEQLFKKGEHWYCRIDILGRRWGRDFLRWGIMPFLYHKACLERVLEGGL